MIRDEIAAEQKAAMKAGDKPRTAATRAILAAIKNRDIEDRTGNAGSDDDDARIVQVLTKMAKQRRESIAMFEKGGRAELAEKESAELAVVEEFMPAMMSAEQATAAVAAIIADIGAGSMKDMGRVMGEVKARHGGTIDMSRVSGIVKAALSQ